MTYDLRRLRLKDLIRRLPNSNTYMLTPDGITFAVFYTKVGNRLLGPLMAATTPTAPLELRRALRVIDHNIDHAIHSAGLKAAA
jgi:predicted MarR family transcription regulator